jgi:hypothetical protein
LPHLSRWLKALADHLSAHWVRHLIPALAVLVMLVVFGWMIMGFWIAIFGGTFLLMAMELETAALICFFGVSALGSLCMVLYQLAGAVFFIGYARFTLRLQQGRPTTPRELLWGFRHPVRSLGLVFALFLVFFASAGLLYLPLIFLGGWMMLSVASLVDGDRGLLGSMGRAWSLSGRAYGELLLLVLATMVVCFVASVFPIIGPVAAPLLGLILGVVVYDSLMRE